MPAAAVIPAPRVYIKVVAVKKLVVGLQVGERSPRGRCSRDQGFCSSSRKFDAKTRGLPVVRLVLL